jgi:hypothetical protein
MKVEEDHLETNISHLIQAAYGPSSRPSRQARDRVFCLLHENVRAVRKLATFPELVLALLGGSLVALGAWWIASTIAGPLAISRNPYMGLFVAVLVINLIFVPAAGTLVVVRRRYG